jgi:hypothetical protein
MRDADIMTRMTRIDLPPGAAKLVALRIADWKTIEGLTGD